MRPRGLGAADWGQTGAIAPPRSQAPAAAGLTLQPPAEMMITMDSKPTPQRTLPPLTQRAADQLRSWEQLRDQLQRLNAELEYLRLMLKLNGNKALPGARADGQQAAK